jgi:hypothetical protein
MLADLPRSCAPARAPPVPRAPMVERALARAPPVRRWWNALWRAHLQSNLDRWWNALRRAHLLSHPSPRDRFARESARRWFWNQYFLSHPSCDRFARESARRWFWNQYLLSHSGWARSQLVVRATARGAVGTPAVVCCPPQGPAACEGCSRFFHQERAPVARSACASGHRAAWRLWSHRERAGAGGARRGALGEKTSGAPSRGRRLRPVRSTRRRRCWRSRRPRPGWRAPR